ncbi:hypothetical protein Cgig2_027092 [Carnegiea gigantea]|uniref:Fe2OG dioxygenase domain-containing protein n=1 Tax=Carnegiea gigantea TaxID=171969 RepID=A0A9Q1K899_9CARY|nr:hypothetical protein Cgig2_027092 [Carnegiea gigantea]
MADDLQYMDSNIIDFSLLSSPSPTVAASELSKLMEYITNWVYFRQGKLCMHITNIGLSIEFLDKVLDLSKHFFTLPFEEKKKFSRSPDNPRGFAVDGDPENPSEACNRLFLLKKRPERWPQAPQEFSLHCESTTADSGAMTFLLIDREVEALEVLKEDQWFKVPIIPHAIVVLVDDQIEIMSNGIVKSVEHRVKPNLEKVRISTALFHSPNVEKEVGSLKALVTEGRPPLYKTVKSYINLFDDHFPINDTMVP